MTTKQTISPTAEALAGPGIHLVIQQHDHNGDLVNQFYCQLTASTDTDGQTKFSFADDDIADPTDDRFVDPGWRINDPVDPK